MSFKGQASDMTGTLINAAGVVAGGLAGHFFGKLLKERHQESLIAVCGVSVLFIGTAGAIQGMLSVKDGVIESGLSMLVTLCLAIGTLIGELINIEGFFERFGEWLKIKTGNAKDKKFVDAFVTASLTVCIGAMAVVGAIQDGIIGDLSILALKTVLDFIIIMVMTCSLGKGCAFSAIPILIFEGFFTLSASFLKPVLAGPAMDYLSMIGSILIFCVGLNLVWGKRIRVANMLPALVLAVAAAYLPV